MEDLRNKKILILGLSKSGISAAKYLSKKGAVCYITESNKNKLDDFDNKLEIIEDIKKYNIKLELGEHTEEFLKDSFFAVSSPGISPRLEIFKLLKKNNIKVISEVELAYIQTKTPFIGITGTNGKTTTTMIVSHILSERYKAPVCGNIGIPPTSLIDMKNDFLVCELSSYQLELTERLKPEISCFLNFTPDHIDWHGSLDNYFLAKTKIFKGDQKPLLAIFSSVDQVVFEFGELYLGKKFFFGSNLENQDCCFIKNIDSIDWIVYKKDNKEENIIKLEDIKLVGDHNYQNIMVGIIVAKELGLSNEEINSRIQTFNPVEHRIEFVKKIGNIEFYNDSKATNPEASIVAIKSFPNKRVTLIAGGRDKNTDLTQFCKCIKEFISDVILYGEARERFYQTLKLNNYNNINKVDNLEEAVKKSIEIGNEISLLSPACSSFDSFKNYEERGRKFKEYVIINAKEVSKT